MQASNRNKLGFRVVKGAMPREEGVGKKPLTEKQPRSETPDQKSTTCAEKSPPKKVKVLSPHSCSKRNPAVARALAPSPAPVRLAEQKSIDDLPEEVLQHILARLPRYSDNLVARRVCRTWRAVAKDPAVVRSYFDIGDPQRANERYYSGLSQPADAGRGWLALQPSLRFDMRAILVGWLTEVHHEFRLSPKTLFLAVGFLDRLLLVRPNIARSRFQLYGLTCLWVASKFEDVTSNSIQDLVWICDDAYSRQDFEAAEQELLLVLEWRLAQVTTVCFLTAQLEELAVPVQSLEGQRTSFLARMLCELSLLDYQMLREHRPSLLATAAIVLASVLVAQRTPDVDWLARVAGVDLAAASCPLNAAIAALRNVHIRAHGMIDNVVVFDKYRLAENLSVAVIAPAPFDLQL